MVAKPKGWKLNIGEFGINAKIDLQKEIVLDVNCQLPTRVLI